MRGLKFRLSYGALFHKKRRLLLSVLGIVIGMASIVVMIAVGEGSKAKVMREFETFSPDTITVISGRVRIRGGRPITTERYKTLKLRDAKALEKVFGVVRVAPVFEGAVTVEYGRESMTATVVGSTPSIFSIRRYRLRRGRVFSSREAWHNGKVAVIGYKVWKELFNFSDPIGQRIRIRKLPFLVVGLMEKMGTDASGRDLDSQVIVPVTSAMNRLFNADYLTSIYVQTMGERYLDVVSRNIDRILHRLHGISKAKPKDYSILKAEEILKNKRRSAMIFSAFIVSIAFISILVGSFGVMAVMILSVKERRREIGIRKAFGATNRSIALQFLRESIFVSSVGGILGLASGVVISIVVSMFAGYPLKLPLVSSAAALLLTIFIGGLSGLYPALRAAKVNPIETLRD